MMWFLKKDVGAEAEIIRSKSKLDETILRHHKPIMINKYKFEVSFIKEDSQFDGHYFIRLKNTHTNEHSMKNTVEKFIIKK